MELSGTRETRAFASEVKFVLPRATALAVMEWARRELAPDPYGTGPHGDEYHTSTIYFDSAELDVYHRRRSFGRCKYRIRRYEGHSDVFLERKLRRPGMLAKRRTIVGASSLLHLEEVSLNGWPGNWFHRRLRLRGLRPVCEIGYTRVARIGNSPAGPIRLTLDDALHVAATKRPTFGHAGASVPILDGCMIVELKFRADVPALFKRLVEEFRIVPQTASKYRIGMAALVPDATSSPEAIVVPTAAAGPLRA
jgi:hypothetical protein